MIGPAAAARFMDMYIDSNTMRWPKRLLMQKSYNNACFSDYGANDPERITQLVQWLKRQSIT